MSAKRDTWVAAVYRWHLCLTYTRSSTVSDRMRSFGSDRETTYGKNSVAMGTSDFLILINWHTITTKVSEPEIQVVKKQSYRKIYAFVRTNYMGKDASAGLWDDLSQNLVVPNNPTSDTVQAQTLRSHLTVMPLACINCTAVNICVEKTCNLS